MARASALLVLFLLACSTVSAGRMLVDVGNAAPTAAVAPVAARADVPVSAQAPTAAASAPVAIETKPAALPMTKATAPKVTVAKAALHKATLPQKAAGTQALTVGGTSIDDKTIEDIITKALQVAGAPTATEAAAPLAAAAAPAVAAAAPIAPVLPTKKEVPAKATVVVAAGKKVVGAAKTASALDIMALEKPIADKAAAPVTAAAPVATAAAPVAAAAAPAIAAAAPIAPVLPTKKVDTVKTVVVTAKGGAAGKKVVGAAKTASALDIMALEDPIADKAAAPAAAAAPIATAAAPAARAEAPAAATVAIVAPVKAGPKVKVEKVKVMHSIELAAAAPTTTATAPVAQNAAAPAAEKAAAPAATLVRTPIEVPTKKAPIATTPVTKGGPAKGVPTVWSVFMSQFN